MTNHPQMAGLGQTHVTRHFKIRPRKGAYSIHQNTHAKCHQVWHGVDRCFKMDVVFRRARNESQWTVILGWMSCYLNCYVKRVANDNILCFSMTAHRQTGCMTQSNCSNIWPVVRELRAQPCWLKDLWNYSRQRSFKFYYNFVVDRPNSTTNHRKSQWAPECP